MKRILIILGILLAAILVFYISGLYPVAKINGEWISQARIKSQAAILRKIQDRTGVAVESTDFELLALQNIAKDYLIKERLLKEFNKETLEDLLRDEIAELNSEELQRFSELLGLSKEESLELWLMPSIRESLLENKLILKGEELLSWFEDAKKSAGVTLFSRKFSWDGTSFRRN